MHPRGLPSRHALVRCGVLSVRARSRLALPDRDGASIRLGSKPCSGVSFAPPRCGLSAHFRSSWLPH